MNPALVTVITAALPELVQTIKDLFVQANPGTPAPTDAQVHAAWLAAVSNTLQKDAELLATLQAEVVVPVGPAPVTPPVA